jgi:hypothetical protein
MTMTFEKAKEALNPFPSELQPMKDYIQQCVLGLI